MRRLVLRSFQSPGDILMLTAAVRDLHAAHPNQFQTDVRTSADAIWENNPHITRLNDGAADVEVLDMHYPLIHQSNERPYHFIHGYVQFLEQRLSVRIPLTRFRGDIFLADEEKKSQPCSKDLPERFWIIVAGGKYDFTAKWWNPQSFQKVVDHFQGKIQFVQCGEAAHFHPSLKRVINLVGKTTLREFIRLMYHASGVLCPVTLAMHLAAAVETPSSRPPNRPCVVVAGGREPPHWEAYPSHQLISTVGTLDCQVGSYRKVTRHARAENWTRIATARRLRNIAQGKQADGEAVVAAPPWVTVPRRRPTLKGFNNVRSHYSSH